MDTFDRDVIGIPRSLLLSSCVVERKVCAVTLSGVLVAAALLVTVSACGAASGSAESVDSPAVGGAVDTVANDVVIESCGIDETMNRPLASVVITNSGGDRASYVVSLGFLDPNGVVVSTGTATAVFLAPGAKERKAPLGDRPAVGELVCKVTDAQRTAG